MERDEAIKLLRAGAEGIRDWNRLRFRSALPDLSSVNLSGADLSDAKLYYIDLRGANLSRAYLSPVDLTGANLRGASLCGSNLSGAGLCRAKLGRADLSYANLSGANLAGANLQDANLQWTNLGEARVVRCDFAGARMAHTKLANTLLSTATGLMEVVHTDGSSLGIDTISESHGKIPEVFLRGCGLTPWQVLVARLHDPDLTPDEIVDLQYEIFKLRTGNPMQVRPVFLSYSHNDHQFVDQLQQAFYDAGINVWRDIHDAPAGPLEEIVDDAMKNRLVVFVLSSASTDSDWVEHETRRARAIAKEQDRHVLSPIAIDDSWKTCKWPERLRSQVEEYNILDFSGWRDEEFFDEQFKRLAAGIRKWY